MIRKSTYTLLIIFLLLAAVVIFLQRTPGLKNNLSNLPTATESPQLLNWGTKMATGLAMSDDQGRVFKARLVNQQNWIIDQPSGCQLENSKIANSLVQLQTVKVLVEMEAPPALADVGLISPSYQLTVTFNDGSIQKLSVGSIVPTGSGYYVQVDMNSVIVVAKSSIDTLFELVNTACATPTAEPGPKSTLEVIQTESVLSTSIPVP
jgi:hypothetical protein